MNMTFYTHDKRGNPTFDNVPYYIACHADYWEGEICFLKFFANRCSDDKLLGLCSVEIAEKEAELCLIELKDYRYANCGIASNLLNVAENFVYQKLNINSMYLFVAPHNEYGIVAANKLYKSFGYAPIAKNVPCYLAKTLGKDTLRSVLDMSNIDIDDDSSEQQNARVVQ